MALMKRLMKRGLEASRADWSSNNPVSRSNFESLTRRHNSRVDWSTTAAEVEWRHRVMASRPGSESGFSRAGADRSLSNIEITASFWSEGWGTRVFSNNKVYESISVRGSLPSEYVSEGKSKRKV